MKKRVVSSIVFLWTLSILVGSPRAFATTCPTLLPIMKINEDVTSAGYIDDAGNIAIPLTYEKTDDFSENLAIVQHKQTNRYGAINKQGETIIPMTHDELGRFSEGLAAARKGERWGVIDTRGNWIVEPTYSRILPYSEHVAGAQDPATLKYGFITRLGEWIVPPVFNTVQPFSEGRALVSRTKGDDWEHLFINKNAELV